MSGSRFSFGSGAAAAAGEIDGQGRLTNSRVRPAFEIEAGFPDFRRNFAKLQTVYEFGMFWSKMP